MVVKGRVFKYGDNVDTDVIIPARYLNIADVKELSSHAMEDIDNLSQDFSFCKPYRSPERTRNLIQEFLDSTQLSVVQKP